MTRNDPKQAIEASPNAPRRPEWMNRVQLLLPEIISLVKQTDEKLQPVFFEVLLKKTLDGASSGPLAISLAELTRTPEATGGGLPIDDAGLSAEFTGFVSRFSLPTDGIRRLVDLDSGAILTRNLGTKVADIERNVTALVALVTLAKTGQFTADRKTVTEVCTGLGAYDQSNFSHVIGRTEDQGSRVYLLEGKLIRVTLPGHGYVAGLVRQLIEAGASPTSDRR